MWLQEICVKQCCANPMYQEKDLRTHASDPPNFEVTATVINFSEDHSGEKARSGIASTKKQAKQRAAVELLHALGITPTDLADIRKGKALAAPSPYSTSKPQPTPVQVESPMEVDSVMSVKTGESSKNDNVHSDTAFPVVDNLSKLVKTLDISPTSCVELLDLCGKRGLPNPEYKELKEDGPPHCRTFYIECRIKTSNGKGDFVVVVQENQKKKAKNLSAATMLCKIQSEVHTDESIAELLSAVEQQLPEPSRAVCTDRKRCHNLIAHLHHRYHNLIGSAILELHNNVYTSDPLTCDYEEILRKIAGEENFELNYVHLPEKNDLKKYQCYCEMTFSKNAQLNGPPAVCVGEGDDRILAKKNASREAIMFLKVVSKP
ncbi:unnamed protein product [Allacma fusca]|uniref:DRBM domain-containing protein n=1 Tax=Allacma fusca TaxID=39272 RepID=A0A8J2L5U0_9HEXA|nr:unnamed protein product [Allacma fusca]